MPLPRLHALPGPTAWRRAATAALLLAAARLVGACADAATAPAPAAVAAAASIDPTDAAADPATARWSDPRTWPNGVVPAPGADVTIPAGQTVVLDVSPPPLGALLVDGTLEFARQDLALTARRIRVAGALRVGTEAVPFAQRATITLTGAATGDDAALGLSAKALAVTDGGRLDLHGERRVGWTRLAATARAGTATLTLERDVDWHAGDRLVLTPTDFDPAQYDEAVVRAVDGRTVTLDTPLRYAHWGERQKVAGRVVDERAEVGLLTRNVRFRGDDACAATGYCAHIIAYHGGALRVEGTELYLVGQKFALARYPIHWHMAESVAGQYARGNSVWRSFNRCITVHGSHDAVVEGNVCHDHLGHGYFLEDGGEVRNTLAGNLGVYSRVPNATERLLASDARPATFWVTNPDNTVRGNVAAGSQGFGFWYALPEHPTGQSAAAGAGVWPRRTPLRAFADNVAHSNRSGGLNVDDGPLPDGSTATTSYKPQQDPAATTSPALPASFDGFVAYKHRNRGVWLRGRALRVRNAVLADNAIGATFAASDSYLEGGLVVGVSANAATPMTAGFPVRGFEFYDGTVGTRGTTFANYVSSARGPASALGFNRNNAFSLSTLNFAEGATLVNANPAYIEAPNPAKDGDKAAVFLDRDGTVGGHAGWYVAANLPLLVGPACVAHPEWNAAACPGPYGRLQVTSAAASEAPAPATVTRDDGAALALAGSGNVTTALNLSVPLARGYGLALAGALTRPRVAVLGVRPGDWVRVSIPFPAAALTAWRDYATSSVVRPVASLAELEASTGDRYYLAGGVLHLKLVAQAGRDYAWVGVDAR